nr:MAG TPA_asm: hypothetical protein [Caudoviricetes sp.]
MMAAWSAAETRTVEDVRVAGDCESNPPLCTSLHML